MMGGLGVLHALLERSAAAFPERTAVAEPDGRSISYADLNRLANAVRDRLVARGVGPGDRVGIYMSKSIDAVAAIFGTLKAGAAYVPVDPGSPAARAAYIVADCAIHTVLTEAGLVEGLREAASAAGDAPPIAPVPAVGGGQGISSWVESEGEAPAAARDAPPPDQVAYLLYTSGSTGQPKGVTISHRAALSFINWVSETFGPTERDVFSSHAPFHFDLSILDLYVSLKHGATLVLIGETLGKEPLKLASTIAEHRITIWYSTPSILHLLLQFGKLERHDFGALRLILFAGEVFPIPQIRALKAALPAPRYANLYGPTETNVCTYYELADGPVDPARNEPFPIGRACRHYRCRVVDSDGVDVTPGECGELVAAGPGVMTGYWNLEARNAKAFLVDASGEQWYRTGDLVVQDAAGDYLFHGRRDRMVKRRGYRIELGEIEVGLATHPAVDDVAVTASTDQAGAVRIVAWLVSAGPRPSIVELKRFSVQRLPGYMAPDTFRFVERLPRTSTDKTDYQALLALT